MASPKVVLDRLDDNSLKLAVILPPRRNGEPNFAALTKLNSDVLALNPAAFDPPDPPPIPVVEFVDDDEPGSLKAGEAFREKGA